MTNDNLSCRDFANNRVISLINRKQINQLHVFSQCQGDVAQNWFGSVSNKK